MLPISTYLPSNFDLNIVKPDWQDYAAWFVGSLYTRGHTEQYYSDDDYCRTDSRVLKQILPQRDYKKIINALLEAKIVETDNRYHASTSGKHGWSKGYRLSQSLNDANYCTFQLTHCELVRKIANVANRRSAQLAPEVYKHLTRWMKQLTVVESAPDDDIKLNRIRNRDFLCRPCQLGRIHTNLTNMPSEYRAYLRIQDKTLYGIDIVNSQPLLFGLTLRGLKSEYDKEIRQYHEIVMEYCEAVQAFHQIKKTSDITLFTPYVATLSNVGASDISEFIELCLEGRIYERLMELFCISDRNYAKTEFFHIIYGRHWGSVQSATGKAFISEFPDCWDGMCRLKAGDHARLAHRMQIVESYLVIWRTCTRLMRECPDAPLLTIHDSLVTDAEHVDLFQSVLLDEFQTVFGVKPKLKTKMFECSDGCEHAEEYSYGTDSAQVVHW